MRHPGHKIFLCLYLALAMGAAVHLATVRAGAGSPIFTGSGGRDMVKDGLLYLGLPLSGLAAAVFALRNRPHAGYDAVMLGVSAVLLVYLMS